MLDELWLIGSFISVGMYIGTCIGEGEKIKLFKLIIYFVISWIFVGVLLAGILFEIENIKKLLEKKKEIK